MVTIYFGLPRSGKTTLIVKRALSYARRGVNVYTNVPITLPASGQRSDRLRERIHLISPSWLGVYDMRDGVVLLDEGTVYMDSRAYKTMPKQLSDWLMLHGHYRLNIEVYTQRYNGVDVKVRNLCERCYYVRKSKVLRCLTLVTPIDYRLIVPSSGDPNPGEIIEGYQQLPWYIRMFCTSIVYRRLYYRYFDSWLAPELPPMPLDTPEKQ